MGKIILNHKKYWTNHYFVISTICSLLFLGASLVISFLANTYAAESGSAAVTDIVLSNIRVFDVDFIAKYGPLALVILVLSILAYRPSLIPFTAKSVA